MEELLVLEQRAILYYGISHCILSILKSRAVPGLFWTIQTCSSFSENCRHREQTAVGESREEKETPAVQSARVESSKESAVRSPEQ